MNWIDTLAARLSADLPVLIAGPTASGKSRLAMAIADKIGGIVINADALQVYNDWRVLTARPSLQDETAIPHALYGHVNGTQSYSVGDWLREVTPLLTAKPCVIVGGTGLYFSSLTDGLADIPEVPMQVRRESDQRLANDGIANLLAELDPQTLARIDHENPRRVQRAWQVWRTTGRGLAAWQDDTKPATLPLDLAQPIVLNAPKDWLTPRIARRFEVMLAEGALDEARTNAPTWHPELPSAKAIGARELIAHERGETSLDATREAVTIQTRQFAKRQRSWFRARMQSWQWIDVTET